MTLLNGLQTSPGLLLFACVLFGLAIGSFLNVVILRLPKMLEIEWRADAKEILAETDASLDGQTLSLSRPASRCPSCDAAIRPWQNIPVISWLLLRGKCAKCAAPISFQYPLIELLAAALAAACVVEFGWSLQLLAAMALCWTLLALAAIDLKTQLLPDSMTLPLMWLGLIVNIPGTFVALDQAVIGAAAGYGSFWLVFQIFRLLTGKDGMGFGDFKLLAALGAWLGWQQLPMIILISSVIGAATGILFMLSGRLKRDNPMPFGPFLAVAGLVLLFWGDTVSRIWLGSVQGG